jgi:hypothetical protein
MAEATSYLRVIGSTALQGVFTGAWVAAGELPAGKRRAVRTGISVATAAVGWLTTPEDERPDVTKLTDPDTEPDPDRPERSMAVALAAIGLGIGIFIGGRKLEKRWLAGLQASGHPHPYRALGLRIGLLTAAGTLPAQLLEAKRKAG